MKSFQITGEKHIGRGESILGSSKSILGEGDFIHEKGESIRDFKDWSSGKDVNPSWISFRGTGESILDILPGNR